MTNGGADVTSGGWRDSSGGRMAAAWLAIAGFGLLHVVVNAASVVDERRRAGQPTDPWEPWLWEGSSTFVWLMLLPLIFLTARRLQPPRFGLASGAGLHLLLTLPVSLAHVGLMNAIRVGVYGALGQRYAPSEPLLEILFYEYRKDVVTYALMVAFFLLFERVVRPQPRAGAAASDYRIEVRDGSRTRWVAPEDVEWAQAAGNYVELHGAFGTLLHRQTLAALEAELADHGFVRVHRSRLVRTAAVQSIETRQSGDFDLALASGERIAGSRRFRDRL